MLSAFIVENEKPAAADLLEQLEKFANHEVEVVGVSYSFADALQRIPKVNPDLLFLDVEIGNGKTSFDLLDCLPTEKFAVIFITGYEQYAIQAFRISAVDYLLKPVTKDSLIEAVARVNKQKQEDHAINMLQILRENLKHDAYRPFKMTIPDALHGFHVIDIDSIMYIKTDEIRGVVVQINSAVSVREITPTPFTTSRTIKYFEDLLDGYNEFYKISQSAIISTRYLQKILKDKLNVLMKDGSKMHITENRVGELMNLFKRG